MIKTTFRLLIVIYLLLLSILLLDTFVLNQEYPEASYAYLEWFYSLPRTTFESVLPYIGMVLIAATILSGIGMLFFNSISRIIFTVSVTTSIILNLTLGISLGVPQLLTVIPIIVDGLGQFIAGLLIAMSYWSNINVYFNK